MSTEESNGHISSAQYTEQKEFKYILKFTLHLQ